MKWYKGNTKTLLDDWTMGDNPFWADYQVLGPNFAGASIFIGMEDVIPLFVGARGCAAHIRFTMLAWGEDFKHGARAVPYIQVSKKDVVDGRYLAKDHQINELKNLTSRLGTKLIVLMNNDNALLSCADLNPLQEQLEAAIGLPVKILDVSPMSDSNQWIGYDKALGLLFEPFMDKKVPKKEGINLVGWKWQTRERRYDIGACLSLLDRVGVKVNHVVPGGFNYADVEDSLASQANLLWCPAYIGDTLERIAEVHDIPIAGYISPYGIKGTEDWLEELGNALGNQEELKQRVEIVKEEFLEALETLQNELKGVKGVVSGGPGRLIGLLNIMSDLKIDIVSASLYWPHSSSQKSLNKIMKRFDNPPQNMLVGPSLYELEEIAQAEKPDFWMGGFQEMHTCKRHGIPFIPTTVYLSSHQCFEGVITVGEKIKKALKGFDFVANVFSIVEE